MKFAELVDIMHTFLARPEMFKQYLSNEQIIAAKTTIVTLFDDECICSEPLRCFDPLKLDGCIPDELKCLIDLVGLGWF